MEGNRDNDFGNICMFSPQAVPIDTGHPLTLSRPEPYSLVTISTRVGQYCVSYDYTLNCINYKLGSDFYLSLASENVLAVRYMCIQA